MNVFSVFLVHLYYFWWNFKNIYI